MLFVLYTKPISRIIHQCDSYLHKFLDDTQLFSSALSAAFGKSFLDPEYSFAAVPRITWTRFVKQQTFVELRTDSVGLGSTNTQTINVHPVKNGLQTLASPCLITLLLSVVLPTWSCTESVPSVHSSLQVGLQLLSALEFYLRLITALPSWQVALQITRPNFKQYTTTQLRWSFIKSVVSM